MIYLVLSFFITFSAHSRGHSQRGHGHNQNKLNKALIQQSASQSVAIVQLANKHNQIMDSVNANKRLLNEILTVVSNNQKTIHATKESCSGIPLSSGTSNPKPLRPRLLKEKKGSTGQR